MVRNASSISRNASTMSGSKCLPRPCADDLHRLFVRERRLVDAPRDQRIVDVGDAPSGAPRSGWSRLQAPAGSPSRPISPGGSRRSRAPAQERASRADQLLRRRIASRPSVVCVFMISNSSRRELAGLQQDRVRNADLADVMQRRRLVQQFDGASSAKSRTSRMCAARRPARARSSACAGCGCRSRCRASRRATPSP